MRFLGLSYGNPAAVAALAACLPVAALAQATSSSSGLAVQLSVANGFLNGTTDGHVTVMFAPSGTDPMEDTDVTSSPNLFFGMDVFGVATVSKMTMASTSILDTAGGVWGFPVVSLDDVPAGNYSVQAYFTKYETVKRSDGSSVSVHFPCGDGAPNIGGFGSLFTAITDVSVTGDAQTVNLVFNNVTATEAFTGKEIGGCSQGNYEDTETLKYVKIRSEALSKFWGRRMYVGANIVLPSGYDPNDTATRYPVIYSQGHWGADAGPFRYPTANFSDAWDNGTIPGANGQPDRPTPKMILVSLRHESPWYDDSYAVNSANHGPFGDAISEELIPYIDEHFNTIPEPYARIQVGGSTGGWESIASVIFRPDLYGACFSSYPDSLDFHRHQDIPLYSNTNAYLRANGSAIPSIRDFENGTQVILATVAQENHWELTFGTSSRSSLQWDVWNSVFGVQGLNGYPLEPWNKITGEIYPAAVEYWRHMDLADYIVTNWNNSYNLGEVLRGRLYVYVGSWDDYFLNEGVQEFQKRTDAVGGPGWANITILPEKPHGGNYQDREIWDYLELVYNWIQDHGPNGTTPLPRNVTMSSSRGNNFTEVLAYGGHQAALKRQAPPSITGGDNCDGAGGCVFQASVGRWDPGVELEAQWVVSGKPVGEAFGVAQGESLSYAPTTATKRSSIELWVTGRKMGYVDETRKSNGIMLKR
ncbi:enterochelin esterase-like enzyme [Cladophialophora carrionii]|uniref:Enterochelin esterase-like enzyme n=1 Tax=Cladophialophora carrionii TaxID=86049 RepID=A0A1C1CQW8_9EURO|nr:enterochelin esterase-like enzyme [Cladophialophora carrionii]